MLALPHIVFSQYKVTVQVTQKGKRGGQHSSALWYDNVRAEAEGVPDAFPTHLTELCKTGLTFVVSWTAPNSMTVICHMWESVELFT